MYLYPLLVFSWQNQTQGHTDPGDVVEAVDVFPWAVVAATYKAAPESNPATADDYPASADRTGGSVFTRSIRRISLPSFSFLIASKSMGSSSSDECDQKGTGVTL